MQRRVVITGIGTVTSIGIGCESFWNSLLAGRCGISPVDAFDTSAYNVHRGAEVKGFCAEDYVAKLDPSGLGRASQFAIAAARLALADAGVDASTIDPERVGVSMGTTSGEPRVVERFDDRFVSRELDRVGSEFISLYPCHVIATHVASELDFAGINVMIPCACA